MKTPQRKALDAHRTRRKRSGFARLEVEVRKEDAGLVRGIAKALRDPAQARETRALLRSRLAPAKGLKDLLASAPLDGIDFARPRDFGRDVDL
ncbi:MAG TPA: hypothetical protein VHU87_04910 [Rhizomicrobium sp.]|jgi:hypothetical protein|nr:hypothetical protein [Rhizomicrobium sp.]